MTNDKHISNDLSKKVLFLGVSMKTKGGMTAVLVSYDKYIDGMRFIPTWKLGNKLVKAWYALQSLARTWWLLKFDKDIEIVHIHGAANASFARCTMFINLAKRFGKKVILHEHAADFVEFYNDSADKAAITDTLRKCDCLIVLSESWRKYFESIGVDSDKIKVLNNIVSPAELLPAAPRTDRRLRLMYMGEISNRKGAFDLLKAIARDKDFFKGRLSLRMGGNQVDGDINAFIRDNSLGDIVSYEGWIAGKKKTECLNWEDVYILPSYNEGLPIAILEAMAYSHPVISTPVGGIPEVVSDGVNGLLVTPGSVDEIAAAVSHYIEHPDDIARHGAKSFEAVSPFLPERVFADLKAVYQTLLSSK